MVAIRRLMENPRCKSNRTISRMAARSWQNVLEAKSYAHAANYIHLGLLSSRCCLQLLSVKKKRCSL